MPEAPAVVPEDQGQAHGTPDTPVDQAPPEADSSAEFTSVDINTLPEELKGTYKSLQADYTRKTQELSKVQKEIQGKASAFDQLSSNPGFAQMMDNIEKFGTPTPAPTAPKHELTGEEVLLKILENPQYLKQLVRDEALALVSPLTEKEAERESQSVYTKFTSDTETYPYFKEYETQIAEMLDELPNGIALDKIPKYIDSFYKSLVFDRVRVSNDASKKNENREKAAALSPGSSAADASAPKGKMSMQQAFQSAMKEHGL